MSYSLVGRMDELWVGEKRSVTLGGRPVLLVRTENGVFAYRAECPHKGVSLCDGSLSGAVLTCPAHGWEFDIETGAGVNPRTAMLTTLPLRIDGNEIWIDGEASGKGAVSGPTVHADKMGHAIAAAIAEENPGTRVFDRGSYLRIESPNPCRLSMKLLEKHLNREVDFPADIELAMSSFKGRISIDSAQITWNSEVGIP